MVINISIACNFLYLKLLIHNGMTESDKHRCGEPPLLNKKQTSRDACFSASMFVKPRVTHGEPHFERTESTHNMQ